MCSFWVVVQLSFSLLTQLSIVIVNLQEFITHHYYYFTHVYACPGLIYCP